MITDSFVELILDEYEVFLGHRLKSTERAVAKEFMVSDISEDSRSGDVTRKLAALILHKSLQRFTEEKDDDWGFARNFKDIYDCRVCANAVAQVSVKGILMPVSKNEFGMVGILSEKELREASERLFFPRKRVTKLLGLQEQGN